MMNLIAGVGSHTSSYPCILCTWRIGTQQAEGPWPLRTWEGNREQHLKWVSLGKKETDLQKYQSMKNMPVLKLASGPISKNVVPPGLHLMLGLSTKIWAALVKECPAAEEWLKSVNVVRQKQRGGQFDGNSCRRIMTLAGTSLRDYLRDRGSLEAALPYINLFTSLDTVVQSCFGSELRDGYEAHLHHFQEQFEKLNISKRMTKYHMLSSHLIPFLSTTSGKGLAFYNESCLEATHYDHLQFLERHAVKATESNICKDRLLKSVLEYNFLHT